MPPNYLQFHILKTHPILFPVQPLFVHLSKLEGTKKSFFFSLLSSFPMLISFWIYCFYLIDITWICVLYPLFFCPLLFCLFCKCILPYLTISTSISQELSYPFFSHLYSPVNFSPKHSFNCILYADSFQISLSSQFYSQH